MTECSANPAHTVTRPGYAVCDRCADKIEWLVNPRQSESVPAHYARLDATPGTSAGTETAHQRPESRSPANDHVISLMDHRTTDDDVTNAWLIFSNACARLGAGPVAHAAMPVLAQYIAVRLDYVHRCPWAGDFLRDLRRAHSHLRQANGEPRPAAIGTCALCDNRLYPGAPIECRRCGAVYDVSEQIRMMTGG